MSELATVTPKSQRRLPGHATANPLIAAVAGISDEHVRDLDAEIEATEQYLQGLRAVRSALPAMLGEAEPEPQAKPRKIRLTQRGPVETETVKVVQVSPVEVEVVTVPEKVLPPAQETRKEATEGRDDDDDDDADEEEAILTSLDKKYGDVQSTDLPRTPAATKQRESVLLPIRRKAAEFVFKKGVAAKIEVIRGINTSPRIINELLAHKWFSVEDNRVRLTQEGRPKARNSPRKPRESRPGRGSSDQ